MEHKHRKEALHSIEQQRMFYALAADLGYKAEEVKERARTHFRVNCFNDLTKGNMMYLIDRMVQQQEKREELLRRKELLKQGDALE
jgi:hypothetical protein